MIGHLNKDNENMGTKFYPFFVVNYKIQDSLKRIKITKT